MPDKKLSAAEIQELISKIPQPMTGRPMKLGFKHAFIAGIIQKATDCSESQADDAARQIMYQLNMEEWPLMHEA